MLFYNYKNFINWLTFSIINDIMVKIGKGGDCMELFMQYVSSVGFPIIMCIIIFKQMQDNNKSHSEEMKEFTTAITNNTIVMNSLVDKIEQMTK